MNCPQCDGPVWDNRETKRNPKAPDFKCKDRSCGWVKWPPKDAKPKAAHAAHANGQPKWTWVTLGKTYERCLLLAELRVQETAARLKLPLTMESVLAGAATLFISASRDGVAEPVKKLPPPKSELPLPDAAEEEDDDLPY